MKKYQLLAVAAAVTALSVPAIAAVSAAEAAKLGKELTPMGAIKAGNADGSIPAYTGGMTKPPAGYKPGMKTLPDPFADEKPILKIDASNMEKYADKLSEGAKVLLKMHPGYYLNVYPSHRTYAVPKVVEDATVQNASNPECRTEETGVALAKACRGGLPFPVPKTGNEAMWNKVVTYAPAADADVENWLLDANGTPILSSTMMYYGDRENYYDQSGARANTDQVVGYVANITGPNRIAGSAQGFSDFLNPLKNPRRSFNYSPGQRRVRMAPEFAYDTPHATLGGVIVYDEIQMFTGAQDRFDYKLVGKKEMYIPYNNYKVVFGCPMPGLVKGKTVNPECERWELHRVWQVEATLKPGMRHIYAKRMYYWDEDNYMSALYDAWDQSGKLYRTGYNYSLQVYLAPTALGPYGSTFVHFDLQKNMMAFTSLTRSDRNGIVFGKTMREIDMQPESIALRGVR